VLKAIKGRPGQGIIPDFYDKCVVFSLKKYSVDVFVCIIPNIYSRHGEICLRDKASGMTIVDRF